jgi:geranylgeranyl diphosphate synthase type II
MGTAIRDTCGESEIADLAASAEAVKSYMASYLTERALAPNLTEAICYALLGPGKRLRPILVLRACEAVGGTVDSALPAAAAIEMIHCFSLVHDDLPAMDDDDLRRGRPTLHKHSNEAMAILAGDAMSALAFEVIATRLQPPDVAAAVMCELATATNDMIVGQVYDTMGGLDGSLSQDVSLRMIHRLKTGALMRASCRMGALCASADAVQLDALSRYGQAIGLMFQVVDDLLDVTQTTEHLGKAAQKDGIQGKLTYPGVLGMDASRSEVGRLRDLAHEALEPLGAGAQLLGELCDLMAVRTR